MWSERAVKAGTLPDDVGAAVPCGYTRGDVRRRGSRCVSSSEDSALACVTQPHTRSNLSSRSLRRSLTLGAMLFPVQDIVVSCHLLDDAPLPRGPSPQRCVPLQSQGQVAGSWWAGALKGAEANSSCTGGMLGAEACTAHACALWHGRQDFLSVIFPGLLRARDRARRLFSTRS